LAGELSAVVLPDGPRRREGPDTAFGASLGSVRADLATTRELPHEGDPALDALETGADLALETASLLFAAGAAHPAWRRWAALSELARFWMLEDEEWDRFHPRSYPDFEPEVCAAARLARRRGYVPAHLDPEAARFLEPGLADGEPEPLPPFAQS